MANNEDNIRSEIIANLLEGLERELKESASEGTGAELSSEDPTRLEGVLEHSDFRKIQEPQGVLTQAKKEMLCFENGEASTQVPTEILNPKYELPSLPQAKDDQKTEVVEKELPGPNPSKVNHAQAQQERQTVATSFAIMPTDNKLQTAHYLKLAQDKISDLEKEIDRLREENDLLVIAGQHAKRQAEEFSDRLNIYERERVESLEQAQMEINIYRENLAAKEKVRKSMEDRIRQLEGAVSKEIKKIRIRERELENRLELSKQEKMALLRTKDESILDLRRRIDDLNMELESHRNKYSELRQKTEEQHGQLSRTVKALRLALAHLETDGENQVIPLKKAE